MGLHKTTTIWKCDECGKIEPWDENTWLHKTILHMKGQWDENIVCCSKSCMGEWESKHKPGRKRVSKESSDE